MLQGFAAERSTSVGYCHAEASSHSFKRERFPHGTIIPRSRSPVGEHLLPIRPHVGADRPAFRAHHARPERRHREIAGQMIDVDDHPVPALTALDERAHAVGAHVAGGRRHGSYIPSHRYLGSTALTQFNVRFSQCPLLGPPLWKRAVPITQSRRSGASRKLA
jgi:hypothetical protein